MPRGPHVLVYIGIRSAVVALDEATGEAVWQTDLRGADFVNVLWDGASLFAAAYGEVWRLHPESGEVVWHNKLTGLGRGMISMASSRMSGPASTEVAPAAAKRRADAQRNSAAAS